MDRLFAAPCVVPDARALIRMGREMVRFYCQSFARTPSRIMLDIDDTFDAVHGHQQLRLFNAFYYEFGFQPIVVFDGEGRLVGTLLRPVHRPKGAKSAAQTDFATGIASSRHKPFQANYNRSS